MLAGTLLFQFLPIQLLGMFNASDELLSLGIPALRIISISFIPAGFSIACSSSFQALGKATYSMFTSIARQLVVLLPVAFALSRFGRVDYVWWAFPVAEVVSLFMTLFFLRKIYSAIICKIGQ